MAKPRSPVLGYNHNIRHKGWIFHVQTEDSGIHSPHVYTHLFHAGVIIASKKVEYDAEADGDVVKGLMQAQHKAVMRELKHGHYDDKIKTRLGDAPVQDTVPSAAPSMVDEQGSGEVMELEAVPLDLAMADAAATLPTPMTEARTDYEVPELVLTDEVPDAEAGGSSPYAQILVSDVSAPAAVSGTLSVGSRGAPMTLVDPMPRAVELDDDDDINGLLDRLRADAAPPELLDDSPTEAQQANESHPGAWVVARPGHKERPFERSSPIPVEIDRDEGARRHLTPPSVELPPGNILPPGSGYSQHRKGTPAGVSTSPVTPVLPAGARPDGTSVGPRRPVAPSAKLPPARPSGSLPAQGKPVSRAQPAVRPPPIPQRITPPPVMARNPSTSATPVLPRTAPSGAASSASPRPPLPASMRSQAATPVLPRGHLPPTPSPGARPAPSTTAPLRSAQVAVTPRRGGSGDSVVVARPAVVIGAPNAIVPPEPSARRSHGRESTPPRGVHETSFGHEMISEKSLDEVIMAYLSEDANEE